MQALYQFRRYVSCSLPKSVNLHAPTGTRNHSRTGTFLFLCFLCVLLPRVDINTSAACCLFSSGRIGVFGHMLQCARLAVRASRSESDSWFYKWTLDLCGVELEPGQSDTLFIWYLVQKAGWHTDFTNVPLTAKVNSGKMDWANLFSLFYFGFFCSKLNEICLAVWELFVLWITMDFRDICSGFSELLTFSVQQRSEEDVAYIFVSLIRAVTLEEANQALASCPNLNWKGPQWLTKATSL